jgi:hypothetical protein
MCRTSPHNLGNIKLQQKVLVAAHLFQQTYDTRSTFWKHDSNAVFDSFIFFCGIGNLLLCQFNWYYLIISILKIYQSLIMFSTCFRMMNNREIILENTMRKCISSVCSSKSVIGICMRKTKKMNACVADRLRQIYNTTYSILHTFLWYSMRQINTRTFILVRTDENRSRSCTTFIGNATVTITNPPVNTDNY